MYKHDKASMTHNIGLICLTHPKISSFPSKEQALCWWSCYNVHKNTLPHSHTSPPPIHTHTQPHTHPPPPCDANLWQVTSHIHPKNNKNKHKTQPHHSGQSMHFKGWGFEILKNCKRVGVHIFPLKRVDWYKGWKQTIKGGVLQNSKLCTYIYKTKLKK